MFTRKRSSLLSLEAGSMWSIEEGIGLDDLRGSEVMTLDFCELF